ncbi:D-tyrosyl-tRNA(Tyr) deacylase [candidate division KSB1 bacterium]|nr:D-tyrosyl-tRNA(Tyr) deacylase [candidate division KSB1 bacterium]
MQALIQRVQKASVTIDNKVVGSINKGLVILLGVKNGDTEAEIPYLAEKCINLRIFEDEAGKMNRSGLDVGAEYLIISQFTLYGDTRHGRRPGFSDAAPPEISRPLYEKFVAFMKEKGLIVATGEFGAYMLVEIHNDGPVTLTIRSKNEQD